MFAALRHFGGRFSHGLPGLLLVSIGICRASAETVTVTQPAPIESLSVAGEVTGVREATVGTHYTFLSSGAGQLTVCDATGHYRIAISATDYVPPPVRSTGAAVSNAAANGVGSQPAISPSPMQLPPERSSSDDADSVTQDKIDAINEAFGKQFFSLTPLWNEPALMIAQRLGLELEGRTKWETSYRRYFSGDLADSDASVLGTGVYCIALYADADDQPTSLLLAFDNDGDYKNVDYINSDLYRIDHPVPGRADRYYPDKSRTELLKEYADDVNSFEPARLAQAGTLAANLTGLFGNPRRVSFGSDAVTREDVQRWDWNGISFLLTCREKKYNLLRIVPTALADNNGRTERIPRDQIGLKLANAVEHRPNGDVIITQIPMADQGPKGYCVPATWERVLRYTGVPGDMYTLSRIGDSDFGGGVWGNSIAQRLDDTLHEYGRHTEFLNINTIDTDSLRGYIDKGIPIFWLVNIIGYDSAMERYALADRDKDWDQWQTLLDGVKTQEEGKQPPLGDNIPHQVLIIGYNPQTHEIAWSDAWGRDTRERWMTMAEAQRCTMNQYYIIAW